MNTESFLTGGHPWRVEMKRHPEENDTDQRRTYYWHRVRKYCEQNPDFNWPSSELFLNLAYVHAILLSDSLKMYSKFGLSISVVNILIILYLGEAQGCKQQELSGLLLVSRANVTKVIDGMEKRGLVVRSASQEDRRARFIKLTEAGRALACRIIPMQNERSVRFTSGLSGNEIDTLNKLLAKFSASIIESGNSK